MEAVECGAASLAMILAYFGRWVPLETLREECGISRDGSKAGNLLKAARKYGLEAVGYKKEVNDLKGLELPMIIFWNFAHFLVLEGIKNNRVYLNDPSVGPRVVTLEEFSQSFTGIALTFKKTSGFVKGGEKQTIVKGITKRLKGCRTALGLVAAAGFVMVVPGLVIPVFSKIFVDDILIGRLGDWFRPLLLGMALTAVLRGALTWIQEYYMLRLETKMALTASAKFFKHVFSLPVNFFYQRFPGEIGSRVQINDWVAKLLSADIAVNALNIVMIFFYALLMLFYDKMLTGIGIAAAVMNFVVLKLVSRRRRDLNMRLLQDQGKLMASTMYGIQAIETLKATGAESDYFSQWSGYHAKAMNTRQHLGLYDQMLSVAPVLLMTLTQAAVLGMGGLKVMAGEMSMGMLVAFQSLMISFLQPVNLLINLGGMLQEADGNMRRLDDVFQYPADKSFAAPDTAKRQPVSAADGPVKLTGAIELKHITFGYSLLEQPLVQDFNLTLSPGSRVALIGGSGSGKSTIAKLVAGLYVPWEGEVLFDGRARSDISRDILTNSIAMVDQEIFMFTGTVRENLTLWDDTLSEPRIIKAARDACIHEDISSRTRGYDSPVEEGGINFSGGQRQRLEIARALAGEPAVVIMDEATSALDATTEKEVDDNIRQRGCTCLIIAHRLSTIRDCDEIIILKQGKVVQRGSHEDLVKEQGAYKELIEAQ